MSTAQSRFWRQELLSEYAGANNSLSALLLTGDLDYQKFVVALRRLIRRHDILRTRFEEQSGSAVQIVEPSSALRIAWVDLCDVPGAEVLVTNIRASLLRRPFELSRPPLFDCVLVRTGPQTHVLLFVIHHIISDGWAQSLFIEELVSLYQCGKLPDTDESVPQYGHFVTDELQRLGSRAFAREKDWWSHYLANASPAALSGEIAGVPGEKGLKHFFTIDAATTAGLVALGSRNRTSLANVLLAALMQTVCDRSGQQECLVGLMSGFRNSAAFERTLGCMINILCLRAKLNAPTVDELVRHVRDCYLDVADHAQFPFEQAAPMLPPRVGGPLEIVYVGQAPRHAGVTLPRLSLQVLDSMEHVPAFPLVVMSTHDASGLRFSLEYDTAYFRAEEIAALADHLQWMLNAFATTGTTRIDAITPGFVTAQLDGFTAAHDPPILRQGQTVHRLVGDRAVRDPNATAITSSAGSISYRALDGWASLLARDLQGMPLRAGSTVAVACRRSIAMVVAWLGVMKAGAVVLPIDLQESEQEIRRRLTQARAQLILTDAASEQSVIAISGSVPMWLIPTHDLSAAPAMPSPDAAAPAVAYLCFTSGSTGTPGAVLGMHAATVNRILSLQQQHPIERHERCLVRTSPAFVDSIAEIVSPLCVGGTLVLCPEESAHDPDKLVAGMIDSGIQRVTLVPTLLRSMLPALEREAHRLQQRITWHVSGEPMAMDLLRAFEALRPADVLLNLYGSAEVAADVTVANLSEERGDLVHVGRPIANCSLAVLDTQLRPTPPCVEGDVYVGGVALSAGYLRDSVRTAERFVPSPNGLAERLYRTGDRGYWLRDGRLRLVGRRDRQIKRRGVRLAPDGIERRLESLQEIQKAAVVWARESQAVIALLVPRELPSASWIRLHEQPAIALSVARLNADEEQQLWANIVAGLPATSLPDRVFVVDQLPLTSAGKIRYASLERIDWLALRLERDETSDAEASETERTLIEICERILRKSGLRYSDRFLEMGMTSLQLVQVLHAVAETFSVRLKLSQLYSATSLRKFAAQIDAEIEFVAAELQKLF
jgi:amino acid adenylation domain-containing protein